MKSLSQRDRARVQQYLDIAEVILVALDLEGRVTFINRTGCSLLGYTEEELLGQEWIEKCLPARIRGDIRKVFHKVLDGDRAHVVNPVLTKSYEERTIGWRNTTLRDDAGRVTGTLSSGQDITERKRAEAELNQLTNRLHRAEDEAQRRVARELHDDLGQALVGLKLKLSQLREGVRDDRGLAALAETREMVGTCLAKVRTLALLLHPPELDVLGLRAAIASYVEGFRERSGIEVSVQLSREFPSLPRAVENALFRITQECLLNVQRHSGGAKAQVRVEIDSARAILEIKDDGVGIPSNGKTGVGLASIAERVKQLNGTLEITSGEWGTLVRAVVPLGPPGNSED